MTLALLIIAGFILIGIIANLSVVGKK